MASNFTIWQFVINYLKRENKTIQVPLSANQGLPANILRISGESKNLGVRAQHITTSSLTNSLTNKDMLALFDQIVLTPEEDLVIEPLRTIESLVERIASVGSGRSTSPSPPGGRLCV
ncbi:hypothetical protein HJG54_29190 [Leptolyngbya sp. NK1-12]|uniref:Uncharacterized protein n=1 Tax=Leptolyngbya sp. NK1-12 TaxID=2547451 RepID=A0AA96WKC1_9CYAN|nr:hypothetical protein [Leptolyngbya sp. NK1-12]WNZ26998.1 hypothetical protein HJG54_29190 [Leptolyngbya sp. NK1-12]